MRVRRACALWLLDHSCFNLEVGEHDRCAAAKSSERGPDDELIVNAVRVGLRLTSGYFINLFGLLVSECRAIPGGFEIGDGRLERPHFALNIAVGHLAPLNATGAHAQAAPMTASAAQGLTKWLISWPAIMTMSVSVRPRAVSVTFAFEFFVILSGSLGAAMNGILYNRL